MYMSYVPTYRSYMYLDRYITTYTCTASMSRDKESMKYVRLGKLHTSISLESSIHLHLS